MFNIMEVSDTILIFTVFVQLPCFMPYQSLQPKNKIVESLLHLLE